jgi:hypothetical protein
MNPSEAVPSASPSVPPIRAVPSRDPLAVAQRLVRRLQRELALRRAACGLEFLFAAGLGTLCAWGLLDQLVLPGAAAARTVSLAWWVFVTASALALAGRIWWKTPRRARLALELEDREPSFKGHLLAAVEALERPGHVPPAVAALAAERAVKILAATGSRPIRPRLPWHAAHLSGLAAVTLLLVGFSTFGEAFLQSLADALFPCPAPETVAASLQLEAVRPGAGEVSEGEAFAFQALLTGPRPAAVVAQVRWRSGDRISGDPVPAGESEEPLSAAADEPGWYRGRLADVRRTCEYRVVAFEQGASARRRAPVAASPWYRVRVRPRESLRELAVLVEPPAYTGAPSRMLTDPKVVEALVRSRLTVLAHVVPAAGVSTGQAELPGGRRVELERLEDSGGQARFRLVFPAARSGLLRLELAAAAPGRAGVQALVPLMVVQDQPPEAEAAIPEAGALEATGLPVEVSLKDDWGLTAARLALRPVPPEGPTPVGELPPETSYEIPLRSGQRALNERWNIPAEGLDAWLAIGFQYRVEAEDNAAPERQTGHSAWRRYMPSRKGRPQAERTALLEPPRTPRPRSLLRPDALSRIPDLTPDELAQLHNPGGGTPAPKKLQRPGAERLRDASAPRGGESKQAQGGGSGARSPGDGYDSPQGLSGEKKSGGGQGAGQSPGGRQGPASGGEGGEGTKPGTAGASQGEGGAAKGGAQEPKKSATSGAGKGTGPQGEGSGGSKAETKGKGGEPQPGGRAGGKKTQEGGAAQTAGGGGGGAAGGEEPGGTESGGEVRKGESGLGGRTPRDGGWKTGREAGPGSGEMAPPDLQNLARMKGFSLEEARKYAAEKGLVSARTDFGEAVSLPPGTRQPGEKVRHSFGAFQVAEPGRVGGGKGEPKDAPPAAGIARLKLDEVDPLYRPLVEAYFRRMREAGEERK